MGKPCVFPFTYKSINSTEFTFDNCTLIDDTSPWCNTRVTESGHYITGFWGYCSESCRGQRAEPSSEFNLASSKEPGLWSSALFDLSTWGTGLCHTYNPPGPSEPGVDGHAAPVAGAHRQAAARECRRRSRGLGSRAVPQVRRLSPAESRLRWQAGGRAGRLERRRLDGRGVTSVRYSAENSVVDIPQAHSRENIVNTTRFLDLFAVALVLSVLLSGIPVEAQEKGPNKQPSGIERRRGSEESDSRDRLPDRHSLGSSLFAIDGNADHNYCKVVALKDALGVSDFSEIALTVEKAKRAANDYVKYSPPYCRVFIQNLPKKIQSRVMSAVLSLREDSDGDTTGDHVVLRRAVLEIQAIAARASEYDDRERLRKVIREQNALISNLRSAIAEQRAKIQEARQRHSEAETSKLAAASQTKQYKDLCSRLKARNKSLTTEIERQSAELKLLTRRDEARARELTRLEVLLQKFRQERDSRSSSEKVQPDKVAFQVAEVCRARWPAGAFGPDDMKERLQRARKEAEFLVGNLPDQRSYSAEERRRLLNLAVSRSISRQKVAALAASFFLLKMAQETIYKAEAVEPGLRNSKDRPNTFGGVIDFGIAMREHSADRAKKSVETSSR